MRPNPYLPGSSAQERYGYRYQCRASDGGCGGVSRVGPPVDRLVTESLLAEASRRLGQRTVDRPAVESRELACLSRLRRIEADRTEYRAARDKKLISAAEFIHAVHWLERQQAEQETSLRSAQVRARQLAIDLPALLLGWDSYTIDVKRARLLDVLSAVIVHPTGRGRRFTPEHIEIVWK